MMDWQGRRVLIVGAARQGTALARYLAQRGAQVVLNDRRSAEQLTAAREALAGLPVEWVTGGHPLSLLEAVDLVCPSGGVPLDLPLVAEAVRRGIPLSNDSQIFLEEAPCPVVGITGSAGKTTTTALVGRMASASARQPAFEDVPRAARSARFRRVWVGGNIGTPLIPFVDAMRPDDLAVMELSSFQLEVMTRAPQTAAVLNVTPNHLDRHGTMEAYTAAKARLLDFQTAEDVAVLNREDPIAWGLRGRVQGRLWTFGLRETTEGPGAFFRAPWVMVRRDGVEEAVLSRSEIRLRGEHNLLNVLAACTLAAALGLEAEAMRAGVVGFGGVPHRLEYVRTWRGAHWYNDSIATAPERSMAAMRAFSEPLVLLAGGRDKQLPWDAFADLVRQRVDHLVLFGEAAEKIRRAVGAVPPGGRPYTISVCDDLYQAVQQAAALAEPGDVVLLSPGGTSFDAFRDFEERGEKFRQWVMALP